MIGITGLGAVAAYRPAARRSGTAAFHVDQGETQPAEAPAPAAAVAPPSLLGLQEAQQDAVGDREARRHAGAALDTLRDLQLALLGRGTGSAGVLDRALRTAPAASDPVLAALQRAVLLRVAVEGARHRAAASL